jgi:hypothetical protein
MTVDNTNDPSLFNDDATAFLESVETQLNNGEPADKEAILSLLVGEGKKYKTVEDALRSTVYKEDHIRKLEYENKQLREASLKAKTTEELLNAIRNNKVQDPDDTLGVNEQTRQNTSNAAPTTKDELLKEVLSVLEERKAKDTYESNLQTVKTALVRQFGTQYGEALNRISVELGLSQAEVDNMAKRSPKAFLKLVGVDPKVLTQNPVPNPSSFRSPNPENLSADKGYKFYENLRKKDPRAWESPKTQNEITQQALKLGPRFYEI